MAGAPINAIIIIRALWSKRDEPLHRERIRACIAHLKAHREEKRNDPGAVS